MAVSSKLGGCAWVGTWPTAKNELAGPEFGENFTDYMGLESQACRHLSGQLIPSKPASRVCDAYGLQLGLACLPDRAHLEMHDGIAGHMFETVLQAGITGTVEPANISSHVLPLSVNTGGD